MKGVRAFLPVAPFLLLGAAIARADDVPRSDAVPASSASAAPATPIDYVTPRIEPAGFPLIAGNSDIGFEMGGVATFTRFADGVRPYIWNIDVILAISLKDSPSGGLEIAQQNYFAQFDTTGLFGGLVRSTSAIYYQKFIDTGYFGQGNASSPTRPPIVDGAPGRFFQYDARELRVRSFNRVRLVKPVDLMIAPIVRYHDPEAYAGSKLAVDAASRNSAGDPIVRGVRPTPIGSLGVGIVFDTRDNEFFPHHGMYHQIGTRYAQGLPIDGDVAYGGTGAILAGYVPLGRTVVFASRLVADFLYGHVPFYDLYNAGPFNVWEMPGGGSGVRGVPLGRYSGPIKMIANAELRAMLTSFKVLEQKFKLGGDLFGDTGRVWDDYTFRSARDGKSLGLKWGAGAGVYLQWGEAAVFRVEMAYSPDAADVTPGFPFGLYVADGVMF